MFLDDFIDIIRACRRSRVKLRVYDALKVRGVATVMELADAAKTTADRVLLVMHGDDRRWRRPTGLVPLRVAELRETTDGGTYAITIRGARAHAEVHERLTR